MLWRDCAIFLNITIFWSNFNLDLHSYGQPLSLFLNFFNIVIALLYIYILLPILLKHVIVGWERATIAIIGRMITIKRSIKRSLESM